MRGVHGIIFGSLSGLELMVIGLACVLIFGGRLPEVAMRAIAHVMRARRSLSQMWRDTGLEDELRRVRREIEMKVPRTLDYDVKRDIEASDPARLAAARAREASAEADGDGGGEHEYGDHEFDVDPDADRRESYSFEPFDDAIAQGDVEPRDDFGDGPEDGEVPDGDGDIEGDGDGPSGDRGGESAS